MTKPILATLTALAALVYSPAYARTDLSEDWTDHPSLQRHEQQQQYAARTECEVHNSASSPLPSQPASPTIKKPSLLERMINVLKDDCRKVRLDKNEIVCEDYTNCLKQETTGREYIDLTTRCVEWQIEERWRMDHNKVGKVEALLSDPIWYALRPIGKDELYIFHTETATRRMKYILNSYEEPKP